MYYYCTQIQLFYKFATPLSALINNKNRIASVKDRTLIFGVHIYYLCLNALNWFNCKGIINIIIIIIKKLVKY